SLLQDVCREHLLHFALLLLREIGYGNHVVENTPAPLICFLFYGQKKFRHLSRSDFPNSPLHIVNFPAVLLFATASWISPLFAVPFRVILSLLHLKIVFLHYSYGQSFYF